MSLKTIKNVTFKLASDTEVSAFLTWHNTGPAVSEAVLLPLNLNSLTPKHTNTLAVTFIHLRTVAVIVVYTTLKSHIEQLVIESKYVL